MAQALRGIESFSGSGTLQRSLHSIRTLRLSLGIITLIGAAIFLLGTSWDIQWHSLIGRDRTLIPPHIMMLTGVALSGLAALAAILIESLWARRSQPVAQNSTSFADAFHGSLGAYIAGFAALDAAIGFPLDSYWHSLYGIDVAIWAPFHVMFAAGMAVVALGAAYMLASAARLAEQEGAVGGKRVAYIGVIAALATMMGTFTLLLFDALRGRGMIDLDIMTINVFSFLASLLIGWTFVAAVIAVPWRWVATSVTGIYFLFAAIMTAFVPAATGWLMAIEHLTFRRSNPGIALVSFEWPLAPILAAVGIDIVMQVARRRHWSQRTLTLVIVPIILIGSIPVIAFSPLYSLVLADRLGIGVLGSVLLALCGAYIGTWFGRRTGEVMQQKEGVV